MEYTSHVFASFVLLTICVPVQKVKDLNDLKDPKFDEYRVRMPGHAQKLDMWPAYEEFHRVFRAVFPLLRGCQRFEEDMEKSFSYHRQHGGYRTGRPAFCFLNGKVLRSISSPLTLAPCIDIGCALEEPEMVENLRAHIACVSSFHYVRST